MPVQFFRRNLPHWQPGAVPYFVTYRLSGSIPKSVLDELKRERQRRLQSPIPANLSQTEHRSRVNKIMFAQWDKYMDKSLGHCWLKQPDVAKLVQTSLYFFAGERLRLWAYVIMPNHVHVLLEPDANFESSSTGLLTCDSIGLLTCDANFEADMEEFCDDRGGILSPIMKSLKGYTGKEANRLLNRRGAFWQEESYNRWVRDEDEFQRIVHYIENNPVKARLVSQPHDWLYSSAYVRRKFHLDFFEPLDGLRSEFVQ